MLWKRTSDEDLAVEQIAGARPVQQQFWLLQQMVPDVAVANIAATLSWRGPLDLLVLQEALLDLVRRHTYLRTTVEYTGEALEQITLQPLAVPIEIVDLRCVSRESREERVQAELAKAAQTPLPADNVPWIRATAVRVADARFEIALVVSHLICDGLSMGVLCAELMQAYAARQQDSAPHWNHRATVGLVPPESRGSSKTSTGPATPTITLPYDFPRPAAPSYRGQRLHLALSEEQTRALVTLSRKQQVSPFVTWLSLLHTVAYRYSSQEQIEIEIPMSGRDRSLRRAVGPLLQSATLRLRANDATTFAQLLQDNALHVDAAGEAVEHSAARRAQLLLDYQTALDEVALTDQITVIPGELDNGAAIAELRLGVRRRRRHFEIHVDFDTDLFSAATAARFAEHLQQVLIEVAHNPDLRLGDVGLLSPAERELIARVNRTERPYDEGQLVDRMFEDQVKRTATAIAVTDEGAQLTYEELNGRVSQLVVSLASIGVGRGDRVALLLDRGIDAVAAMLASLKCGAAFVPVDPDYPPHRQSLVLERADVKCAVTIEKYAERIPSQILPLVLDDLQLDAAGDSRSLSTRIPFDAPPGPVSSHRSEDIAYILFTSGSTGEPKGVQVTHRNLVNFFAGMDALQTERAPGCWLALTSMSFDISIYELLWTLVRGFQVVIEDDPLGLASGDPEALARRMREHQVTHLQCTPALMQALLREPASRQAISELKKVFVGGDVMSATLAQDLHGLVSGDVYNMYGPTETTIWSTTWKLDGNSGQVSIGYPLANTRVSVVDDALRPVPVGVAGELLIGGDGVTSGYFRDPQRSAERFVKRAGEGRMFRTGDLVRMQPDGSLLFLGRRDQQVKLDGHRLELGEIETVLREHTAVREAVAVVHHGDDNTKKIVAFVLTPQSDQPSWPHEQAEMLALLRSRLPDYMVPSCIERLAQMPLTPAKKVDRKRLMTQPLSDRRQAHSTNGAPNSDEMRQRVQRVVCDELQLEEIPATANLATLGVNSLEVVRLVDRIEREFGVRPPIALFFRSHSLADAILEAIGEDGSTSSAVNAQRGKPKLDGLEIQAAGATKSPSPAIDVPATNPAQPNRTPTQLARSTSSAMDRLEHVSQSFRTAFGDKSLHPYARFVDPVKSELLARAGLDKTYTRGEGCYVWDQAGERFLDFVAQYGALPFGYNPPEIWQALERARQAQLPNFATNSQLDSAGRLAERLLQIAPDQMQHVIFCNSGAECTEIAIKLCRSATDRKAILSTHQGFHGLTTGAAAATGSASFRDGFIADDANYYFVPFGDLESLHRVLEERADELAAFIVEPIQGEAGILVPPPGYLAAARKLCTQYEVLLVVDEVQTGLGRTGSMLACDEELVAPDVLLLAKALGGGLVPIGAVLCRSEAYSDRFGLRHSSTFAGNALACQAGMATLDRLQADRGALVRHVAESGRYLQERLRSVQAKYATIVREVRGTGYMQAIEFDFSPLDDRSGLLGFLAQEQLLIYLIASHLLHVHHVRVAPSFVGRDVIRIEPPLTAARAECDTFVAALDATLSVIDSGNTAAFLAPMASACPREILAKTPEFSMGLRSRAPFASTAETTADFGFLIHLASLDDLVTYDESLATFDTDQLQRLKTQLVRSADPFIIGDAVVQSQTGQAVRGHFVMIPYTPAELSSMPPAEALNQVTLAAKVAAQAGAELIGLGGFTSIVSMGGVALPQGELPPITSGNSFTVTATLIALRRACQRRGVELSDSTAAVVGATGQTGRALAMMLAEDVGRLVLVGRDGELQATQNRLREVAAAVVEHLCATADERQPGGGGLLADVSQEDLGNRQQLLEQLLANGRIVLATETNNVAVAEVVVTASNATEAFIESQHLKRDAIIVDSSRPVNVSEAVRAQRPDVLWIEGGVIGLPGTPQLDVFAGPKPDRTFACVAEAMLWALEPSLRTVFAEVVLQPKTIRRLAELAEVHGLRVMD